MTDLTIEYWIDDGWYVGKIKEVPGVFSQGETIDDLVENIKDAYRMIINESQYMPVKDFKTMKLQVDL